MAPPSKAELFEKCCRSRSTWHRQSWRDRAADPAAVAGKHTAVHNKPTVSCCQMAPPPNRLVAVLPEKVLLLMVAAIEPSTP